MDSIVDSYSESNYTTGAALYLPQSYGRLAQSFACSANAKLKSAKFYVQQFTAPSGNVVVKIYAHTGTYGAGDSAVSTLLATSDTVDVATFNAYAHELVTFSFSGAEQINLTSGTKYWVSIEYSGLIGVSVALDTSGEHAGCCRTYYGSTWGNSMGDGSDFCFYVYGEVAATPSGMFLFLMT
jgi:hypothetical protein